MAGLGRKKLAFETAAVTDLETRDDFVAGSMSDILNMVIAKINKGVDFARSKNCGRILYTQAVRTTESE